MLSSITDLLPIREVARQTGVNAVTLRAWERRYGLIQPHRTPKGHRLYTAANVEQIHTIVSWLERGVAVGQVRDLLGRPRLATQGDIAPWSKWNEQLLTGLLRFDSTSVDEVYNQAMASFSVPVVCELLLEPALVQLQRRWDGNFGDEVERVFAFTWLRCKLAGRLYQNNCLAAGAAVVLANLSQAHCEPGVWLLAIMLSHAGHRIELLEWSVPATELGLIASQRKIQALVLYSGQALQAVQLRRELPSLMQKTNCSVYFAGPAALIHHEELAKLAITTTAESPCAAFAWLDQSLRGTP